MIYLDNAATTFPKPESVIVAMNELMQLYGGNPGRGAHYISRKCNEKIFECREAAAKLINASSPDEIVFTKNATEAINLAIKGTLKEGDEIILSSMEHNSVLRSAVGLEKKGIIVKIARADSSGFVSKESISSLLGEKTRLVVVTHASNVCGTVNPIREIASEVHSKGIPILIDAAQSGGVLDIYAPDFDMIAFAGHKGLYGPFGTGILYVKNNVKLETLTEGGTGSFSESAFMPDYSPDRYEAGTLNACGIAGLCKGIEFVTKEGVMEKERELASFMAEQFSVVKGVRIIGNPSIALIGLRIPGYDCVNIAERLDGEFGIATRAGLHCAPMAHRTLGTITGGLLRISAGYFNTKDDITAAAKAIEKLTECYK